MEIIKTLAEQPETVTNCYSVDITTMEGDADDFHDLNLLISDEKELKEVIILLKVLNRLHPDDYQKVPNFEKWFGDENDYDDTQVWECNEYYLDRLDNYCITYYDENGTLFKCEIFLDEEMESEIDKQLDEWKDK